jgi:hypothetical protein
VLKSIVALVAAWLVAGPAAAQPSPKPPANDDCLDYPNNIGHIDFHGCFGCHDDNHKSNGLSLALNGS